MSLFTKVVSKIPKRNAFNLSFPNTLTLEFGDLVPVMCKEVLPGDKFELNTECIVRTAPMLAPVMSQIDVYLHYFMVPNRLLYLNWEDFITGSITGTYDNGTVDTPVAPVFSGDEISVDLSGNGTLWDYLNLPTTTSENGWNEVEMDVSALPFAAYQKIYMDWYQDELIDNFSFDPLPSGYVDSDLIEPLLTLRKRAWKKDYFTSARPDTQLGAEVSIPAGGNLAPDGAFVLSDSDGDIFTGGYLMTSNDGDTVNYNAGTETDAYYQSGISVDGVGITVNDLRRALRLQEWQEKNMRGGNRYIESIFHHFGVRSSDARLQRSQFLGGVKKPILVSDVPQTSEGTADSPQGNLAGKGTMVSGGKKVHFTSEEHGFLICIMSIMPTTGYFQGVPRMFGQRFDRFDYAWPEFSNIGEQEVFNYEIYAGVSNVSTHRGTFGYQSRYAEYKYSAPEVHGEFRDSMDYWHNARIFSSQPSLNTDFIHPDLTDQNRIFPSELTAYGHFYAQLYHNVKVLRRLSKYGIPSI